LPVTVELIVSNLVNYCEGHQICQTQGYCITICGYEPKRRQ